MFGCTSSSTRLKLGCYFDQREIRSRVRSISIARHLMNIKLRSGFRNYKTIAGTLSDRSQNLCSGIVGAPGGENAICVPFIDLPFLRLITVAVAFCSVNANVRADQTQFGQIRADSVLIRLIDKVDVPARVVGSLIAVPVVEGTVVRKDQLLAQIDDTDAKLEQKRARYELAIAEYQAQDDVAIRSARKSLVFAQADYDRLRRANESRPQSVSQSELEKARLEAEQAELTIERAQREQELASIQQNLIESQSELAERNVELRKILSPLNGVVVSVLHRPGEWVKPGDKMFQIVRTDRLRAEGFIAASQVVGDLRGATVTLTPWIDDKPGDTYSGKIVFVSPEIDPINGQMRVWAEVENPDGLLRPGLRANMTIATGTPQKQRAEARQP